MRINAIHCDECDNTVYSRTRHDYRSCTCGSISVDGGREYFKVSAIPGANYRSLMLELDVTLEELYEDWDYNSDQLGLITN